MIRNFVKSYNLKKFYAKLIDKNELCFDIGANIGKKSKILLDIGARVVAFEPQKSCISKLTQLKSKYNNFHFESLALDNKVGKNILTLSNYSEIATLSSNFVNIYKNKDINWIEEEEVKTITINKAIEQFGLPFYCKVDVEGYEFEILSTLKHKISLIEFEVVAGFQEKAIQIINILNRENTLFNFTLNEQPYFKSKNWIKADEMVKVVHAFPKSSLHANIFVKNYGN